MPAIAGREAQLSLSHAVDLHVPGGGRKLFTVGRTLDGHGALVLYDAEGRALAVQLAPQQFARLTETMADLCVILLAPEAVPS